jgi:multiple sugar transport system permease protein
VLNTFEYALIAVPFSIVIAFIMAVMLNQKVAGRSIFRTIYFLPMVAAPAAVAMVWRWLYNGQFGLFNYIISSLGGKPVNFLTSTTNTIPAMAVIGIWSAIGYNMVLFLAGLQEIPKDYYEAAEIDGAGPIRQQFVVTIPLISPTMYFVTVTQVIGAMQIFDIIYMVVDRASPVLANVQSVVFIFYQYSFVQNNKGYGAAIVLLLLVIILLLTAIQNFIQRRWVHYAD